MSNNTMSARFWIRWNGDWCKITLMPGEDIDLYRSEKTDEGWKSEHRNYSFDGVEIVWDSRVSERDCDGLTSRDDIQVALLAQLKDELCYNLADDGSWIELPFRRPTWQEESVRQYDQYAEAAGY